MRFADYPLPPMLIGFVLGQLFEDNFGRAIRNANGSSLSGKRPMAFFGYSDPGFILFSLYRDWRSRKKISESLK
ncbi:MAG: hypothetical protein Ct9H300mP28_27740 [Pseudomonadota bacterium]|nr:MAG: hypothetical protein Ct9H300mP28_27740 [Pseudomonadota bacterium]